MADYKLIGKNYQTRDLVAKVTGKAKYAEDFRADGMLFAKLLLSPMPHARVRRIDPSVALAMPGVEGILTVDDLPSVETGSLEERGLTMEPLYEGEPILAVAAVDEATGARAIEAITVDYDPLPFVVDPLESLRPNAPNARLDGNAVIRRETTTIQTIKWTEEDFAEEAEGRLPMGEFTDEWTLGDVEAGMAEADLTLDETVVLHSTSHQPLETRSAMAHWQNGKCHLYASTQGLVQTHAPAAQRIGVDPSQLVYIGEYSGGAFGSKGRGSTFELIPALLAKKIGKPVMMRISRREEHAIGRARPGCQARVKIGYRTDGRVTAIDLFILQDNGPYGRRGDFLSVGRYASLLYQAPNMRFRGLTVLTNTPPRGAQRAPGGFQMSAMFEPIMSKAARQLGIDQLEMRRINAPSGQAEYGAPRDDGTRPYVTSAFVSEALDRGKALFNWDERKPRSGQRRGSKVTGIGVGLGVYGSGSIGYDGLFTIRPDGKMYIQSGCGNLGTHSVFDTTRAAAEALDVPWEKVEITWGDTSRHLPWTCGQGGSQTTHAHTRANHAAALDAKRKLQELAARDLGGSPDDYEVGAERVYRQANPSRYLTLARAAQRAIELGGRYDGHELPDNLHPWTATSATALAGLGLMGVAKDAFGRDGSTYTFVVGLAEVEIDVETGQIRVVDYTAVADCGTVLHPRSLGAQIHGGAVQGMGCALSQKWVFDQHWGLTVAKRFYSNRPSSILDVPLAMTWDAVNLPDPQTPVGAKGIGEPPIGAGAAAVRSAITDAVGDEYFKRMPTTADMILSELEQSPGLQSTLASHV